MSNDGRQAVDSGDVPPPEGRLDDVPVMKVTCVAVDGVNYLLCSHPRQAPYRETAMSRYINWSHERSHVGMHSGISSLPILVTPQEIEGSSCSVFIQGLRCPSFTRDRETRRVRPGWWWSNSQNSPRHDDSASCLLYTSPSPRDNTTSRMPSSA